MTVVNMMGTDHLPLGRTWNTQSQINTEGLELMDKVLLTYAQLSAMEANGRTWLQVIHQNAGPYGNLQGRSAWFIYNKTFREVFGNPEVITKGTLAMRMYIDPTMATRWASAASTSNSCLYLSSTMVDGSILTNLPAGEHDLEFTIDFVNKEIRSYRNGTLYTTWPQANLSLDSIFSFGVSAIHPQTSSTMPVAGVNDFYVTYDNQDGTLSGRLGSVRVLPMPVDKVDMPASWSFEEDPAQFYTYTLPEGGTWSAHQILPKLSSENYVKGQFNHQAVPGFAAGSLLPMLTENGNYAYYANQTAASNLQFVTQFSRAKKVAGYAIQSYLAGYGVPNTWAFQGSNDGTNWVDLDVRTGQATLLNPSGAMYAYKLPAEKVGKYLHYRLNITNSTIGTTTPGRVSFRHYQLLGEVADVKENIFDDLLSRPTNLDGTDMDFPVVRAALNGQEAVVSFKTPDVGIADVLAVRVFGVHRRDQGTNELLSYRQRVGASDGTERDIALNPHPVSMTRIGTFRQKPDNAPWTKEDLANFRIVVKSKRGA